MTSPLVHNVNESSSNPNADDILNRVGQLTRDLHENLVGLGFDRLLQSAAHAIPNARDRLDYVVKMTAQAADRVLNAVDVASPLQAEIINKGQLLEKKWQAVLEATSFKKDYHDTASETLEFLQTSINNSEQTKQQLLEIMMAQDFQDLTGQVIKKVMELAQDIEKQLLQVLIDFKQPHQLKTENDNTLLNGPQIDPKNTIDAVSDQAQVDDLLDSLGF